MHNLGFELKWSLDTVVTALGFLLAWYSFWSQGQQEASDKRRDTYQKLELASIDLFRFETQNPAIIQNFYFAKNFPAEGTVEREAVKSYVYQILNLFEMALRFREDEVMPPDVFGSWVIWFHDLCAALNFPEIWPEMKFNYLPDLRAIMTQGIELLADGDSELKTLDFFVLVADRVKDPSLKTWILCDKNSVKVGRPRVTNPSQ